MIRFGMVPLAYTYSDELHQKVTLIDSLRKDLHVAPIDRKTLLALQWHATCSRIREALEQENYSVTLGEVQRILRTHTPKSAAAKSVLSYKKALDYIRTEWYVVPDDIAPETVSRIATLVNTRPPKQADTAPFLQFLQRGSEVPVIQAGMAYIQLVHRQSARADQNRLAPLLSYTFLYKYGWDFRELLVLESIPKQAENYVDVLETTRRYNNATAWLNYFASYIIKELQNMLKVYTPLSISHNRKAGAPLSSRQQDIINRFTDPDTHITNRKIQQLYGVSQITASRDLAKLTQLGLLFARSKGRSTYYTKA